MDKILALSIAGAVCFMASTTASAQPTWSIVESKSPTDDSPQIREKIGRACNWPSTPDDTTGSINPSQKR